MKNRLKIFFIITLLLFDFLSSKTPQDLKTIAEKIGKLKFKKDVEIKYFTRDEIKKYIENIFNNEYPDDLVRKESLFLYFMGFTDKIYNIKELRKKIILSNIAGFYNEKTKELYALDEYKNIDMMNSLVIIHELRHAIQDQYFCLEKIFKDISDFDDRKLASLSAVEGDATFIMLRYMDMPVELIDSAFSSETLLSFTPMSNRNVLFSVPPILRYQMIMPYSEGLKFTNYIYKRKGWKRINKVLLNPPVSSEQILHPEKYFKKELPVKVNINLQINDIPLLHEGVIGEYYLNVLLSKDDRIEDYAIGWNGDKHKLYFNDNDYLLLWKSYWDNEKSANNFYRFFKKFIIDEFEVNFKKGNIKGNNFIAGSSDYGFFLIRKFKNKIFYVRTGNRNIINKIINGGIYD